MRKTLTVTSALLLIAALLGLALGAGLSAKNITIRLPSGGAGGEAADDISLDVPPWKCCDVPACSSRDIPPKCACLDLVNSCDGCKKCVASAIGSRYLCHDRYRTYPPPACTERERPWACCDEPRCTLTCPTVCYCNDAVEECAAACRECKPVVGADPPRYRCVDSFVGSPWPRCSA